MKNLLKDLMNEDLPLIGGGVGAGFIKNLAGKVTSNEQIQSAAPFVTGLILKRMKNPMLKYAGMGMISTGGRDLLGTFIPAIKGIESMDLSGLFGNVITENVLNDNLSDNLSGNNNDFTSGYAEENEWGN